MRIGDDRPVVWTPASLKDRARAIHAGIAALRADVQRDRARWPREDLDAFDAWRARWSSWWSDWSDFPLGTGYWGSTATTLDAFEAELRAWRDRARALGTRVTGPEPRRYEPVEPIGNLSTIAIAGAVIAVVFLLSKR